HPERIEIIQPNLRKLQGLTSNIQRNSKLPKSKNSSPSEHGDWSLRFGISLDVGCWSLELLCPSFALWPVAGEIILEQFDEFDAFARAGFLRMKSVGAELESALD